MDRYIERKIGLTKKFEEEYRNVLEELAEMPKKTKEEKEECWKWFREHSEYELIVGRVMEAYDPKAFRVMARREDHENMKPERGKKLDGLQFICAVQDVVKSYKGNQKKDGEGSVSFVACVGQKYKQRMQIENGTVNYDSTGVPMPEVKEKRKHIVMTLARNVIELKEKTGDIRPAKEIIQEITTEKIKAEELEAAERIVDKLNLLIRLDQEVGEGGDTLIAHTEDRKESIEMQMSTEIAEMTEMTGQLLAVFIRNIAKDWRYVKCAAKKKTREWLKAFFTKDLLIELKLDMRTTLTGKEKREWGDEKVEPYCKQWCSHRSQCKLSEKEKGCYVRYWDEPAGTDEIYKILKPYGSIIFNNLLTKDYLHRAIERKPDNFYKVYANHLKDDFDFRDRILGEVIHKDKTAVSKARSVYEKKIKPELYKQFLDSIEYLDIIE